MPSFVRKFNSRDCEPALRELAAGATETATLQASLTKGIPPIIHQTYSTFADLPESFRENIRKLCTLNSDFEYRFYDDRDIEAFIGSVYGGSMLNIYHSLHPQYGAARSDLFRYLCLFAYGGIYLDVKAAVTRPFREVLAETDDFILAHWDQDLHPGWGINPRISLAEGEYQQWFIIASPLHPYLKSVIQEVISRMRSYFPLYHDVGRRATIYVTGPLAYTAGITRVVDDHLHRKVRVEKDMGIYYSIFADPYVHQQMYSSGHRNYRRARVPLVDSGALSRMAAQLVSIVRDISHWIKSKVSPW
jgi:hypothetical protein